MFYIAVGIWALICIGFWILGMRYLEKEEYKKRKR